MSTVPLREELRGLEPYGAPQLDVPVRLNVNENPYGPSPECVEDIAASVAAVAGTLNRYPDREFTELRTALNAARTALGLGALTFTDPTLTAQSTRIKSAHITELRDAVK